MASTYILAVGKIIEGEWQMDVCLPPLLDVEPDGSLQDHIDYAAELQELEDDMLDREFWARGQW